MKKKHPVLYAYLKRFVIVILVLIMGFTVFWQVTGGTNYFELGISFIVSPVQNMVSTVLHEISEYLYRLKLPIQRELLLRKIAGPGNVRQCCNFTKYH